MTHDQKLALIKRHSPTFKLEPYQHGGQHGWSATVTVAGKLLSLAEVAPKKLEHVVRGNVIDACFTDDRIVPRHARLSS